VSLLVLFKLVNDCKVRYFLYAFLKDSHSSTNFVCNSLVGFKGVVANSGLFTCKIYQMG
jgi:hypothetical protein